MASYDLATQETLKNIFSPIVVGGMYVNSPIIQSKKEIFKLSLDRFKDKFAYNIFEDEYAMIYEVIKTMKATVFSVAQLDDLIDRHRELVLDSPKIDISRWSVTPDGRQANDDEKLLAFGQEMKALVIELSNTYVDMETFESSMELFSANFIKEYALQTAQNMTMILGDIGFEERNTRGRRTFYRGRVDSENYYIKRQVVLNSLTNVEAVRTEVVGDEWLRKEYAKDIEGEEPGILDFGITEMDEVMGELRRGNLVTILGPPKGGKTKITNYMVERALSKGLNVCVWPIEGTQEEWMAAITACYIRRKYGMVIDNKSILYRRYDTEEIRNFVISARTEMVTDTTRGRLSFITGTAYVEDFIDIMKTHYEKENPFDVVAIDQLVLLQSKTGRGKTERLSEGYAIMKDFIANKMAKGILALLPAQLKQEVVDYLRRNPTETMDVTAGGETAETVRSADEVLGVFSTKEERDNGKMKLYSVASRHNANFDDFYVNCQLGCSYFYSEDNEE